MSDEVEEFDETTVAKEKDQCKLSEQNYAYLKRVQVA